MTKRSTRRMRGGFLEGIISLFTGDKKPVLPITTSNVTNTAAQSPPPSNNKPVVIPMNVGAGATAGRQPGSTMLNPDPKVPSAFGGARRRRSTRARSTYRKARRSASRKARRATSRKSRCMYRKH